MKSIRECNVSNFINDVLFLILMLLRGFWGVGERTSDILKCMSGWLFIGIFDRAIGDWDAPKIMNIYEMLLFYRAIVEWGMKNDVFGLENIAKGYESDAINEGNS